MGYVVDVNLELPPQSYTTNLDNVHHIPDVMPQIDWLGECQKEVMEKTQISVCEDSG